MSPCGLLPGQWTCVGQCQINHEATDEGLAEGLPCLTSLQVAGAQGEKLSIKFRSLKQAVKKHWMMIMIRVLGRVGFQGHFAPMSII